MFLFGWIVVEIEKWWKLEIIIEKVKKDIKE